MVQFSIVDATIMVHGMEIIPLFDVPHLFKCLRNNLLTKDLEFDVDEKKKEENRSFDSWSHIQIAYEIDAHGPEKRRLKKVTACHMYENKMKKMSVSHATQILSLSMANEVDRQATSKGIDFFDILRILNLIKKGCPRFVCFFLRY